MDTLINKITDIFMNITNYNEKQILICLLFIVFILWLYKQLKTLQSTELERKENIIHSAMKAMSRIFYKVHRIKRSGNKEDLLDSFYDSVYAVYPFLDNEVYKKIDEVMKSLKREEEKVDIISNEIEKVYKNLVRQKEPILESKYIKTNLDRFFHKVGIILIPIFQTIVVFSALLFIIIMAFSEEDFFLKYIKVVTVVPWLYQFIVFIDYLVHRKTTLLGAILLLLSLSSGYLMFFNEGIITFVYFIGWLMLMVLYRLLTK